MFGRKKIRPITYDPTLKKPALRCSICTGETTAGFIDLKNGHFEDICLIASEKDLQSFREQYGVEG